MPVSATLLALGSAVIHASWNLLIKTSGDRTLAGWGQFAAGGLLALPVAVALGGPGWEAAPYLVGSALVHIVYVEALSLAFTHGDFSLTYPLARGTGAVLAAVGGVVLLDDTLTTLAWVAIAIAGAGLLALRGRASVLPADAEVGAVSASSLGPAVGWALLTAACICAYTLVDSAGSREATSGAAYGFSLSASAGLGLTVANLARGRGPGLVARSRLDWWRWLLGGIGVTAAYTMVLVAVRTAPVGYVSMLRESSVVLGALIGWLFLGESLGRRRVGASAVILAGLVLLVAAA